MTILNEFFYPDFFLKSISVQLQSFCALCYNTTLKLIMCVLKKCLVRSGSKSLRKIWIFYNYEFWKIEDFYSSSIKKLIDNKWNVQRALYLWWNWSWGSSLPLNNTIIHVYLKMKRQVSRWASYEIIGKMVKTVSKGAKIILLNLMT